jgi:hypothetical protein
MKPPGRKLMPMDPVTTDWLCVYTSSDGSEQLHIGVMGIDEAHPAILHPENEGPSFLQQGETDRLKSVEDDLQLVEIGRWKYSEREGGELKAFEWVDGYNDIGAQSAKTPKKGKRNWASANYSPTPSADIHTDKKVCGREMLDDSDGDDEDIPPEDEKPESSGSKIERQFAHQLTNADDEIKDSLSPSFANLRATDAAVKDEKKAEPKKLPTLTQLATRLVYRVNNGVIRWARGTNQRDIDLHRHTRALLLAESAAAIIESSREVVADLTKYCDILHCDFLAEGALLRDAKANMKPDYVLAAHRDTVVAYKRNETDARDTARDLETWTEHLEKMVTVVAASH